METAHSDHLFTAFIMVQFCRRCLWSLISNSWLAYSVLPITRIFSRETWLSKPSTTSLFWWKRHRNGGKPISHLINWIVKNDGGWTESDTYGVRKETDDTASFRGASHWLSLTFIPSPTVSLSLASKTPSWLSPQGCICIPRQSFVPPSLHCG